MKLNVHKLRDGHYVFDFVKNCEELALDPNTYRNTIYVRSEVEKRKDNIFVHTKVHTEVHYTCDSCLSEFTDELKDDFRMLYTSDRDYAYYRDDEMVRLLQPHSLEIDLSESVAESLLLARPMKVVCSDDCKGLCAKCGANLNLETCACSDDRVDPRWENLKKLID